MELRPAQADDDAPPTACVHRGALCLILLTRPGRAARALGGVTVPDPSGTPAPCLPLHVVEGLYAPFLGIGLESRGATLTCAL